MASDAKESSIRVVVSAVVGNGIIAVLKLVGWFLTASPSMLAEAIHSVADTANQVLLFVGLKHGGGGPTKEFPWGKSGAQYLWNLISAVGIFFVGFGVTTYHGVHSLINLDTHVHKPMGWVPIGILLLALVIEGYVLLLAIKAVNKLRGDRGLVEYIKRGDDPTTVAVLLEDGVAVIGVLLALFGIVISNIFHTGLPDAITAIVIGVLLGVMAILLAYSNGRLLIGAAAEPETVANIKSFLQNHSAIEQVIEIKTEVLGPGRIRVTTELEFHGDYMVNRQQISRDADRIRVNGEDPVPVLFDSAERMVRTVGRKINEIENQLKAKFPQVDIIEIEVN